MTSLSGYVRYSKLEEYVTLEKFKEVLKDVEYLKLVVIDLKDSIDENWEFTNKNCEKLEAITPSMNNELDIKTLLNEKKKNEEVIKNIERNIEKLREEHEVLTSNIQEFQKGDKKGNNPVGESEEIKHLIGRIKRLKDCNGKPQVPKGKISVGIKSVEDQEGVKNKTLTGNHQREFSCDHCRYSISSKKELKEHVKMCHPKDIRCKLCDTAFEENHMLEYHLQNVHNEKKSFKCNDCERTFVLQWRLDKHVKMHSPKKVVKTCHYFNNGRLCPFQDIGCMFLHSNAPFCKYSNMCMKTMCQYRHD